MRLSQRMARLGTETAFEVLVRARALEAQGRNIVHLEIGEPDFDTPAHITEAGGPRAQGRRHALRARRRASPSCARPSPRTRTRRRGAQATPGDGGGDAGRQADHVLRDPGAGGRGRRGALPEPRLPDLRVDDPLHRRQPGAGAAAGGEGLRAGRGPALRAGRAQDAAHHPELPAQPDRRHHPRERPARHRERGRQARRARALRRDLRPHPLRRRSTARSRPCRAWSRWPSCWTASPRPTP